MNQMNITKLLGTALLLVLSIAVVRAQSSSNSEYIERLQAAAKSYGDKIASLTYEWHIRGEQGPDQTFDMRAESRREGYTTEEEQDLFTVTVMEEAPRRLNELMYPTATTTPTPEVSVTTPSKSSSSIEPVVETLPAESVVSAITSNRWSGDALIVSGTLTNTNAVAVRITNINAAGYIDPGREGLLIKGSDYTIIHNDLAPGETVNFKVALKDGKKQIRFVKVTPDVTRP